MGHEFGRRWLARAGASTLVFGAVLTGGSAALAQDAPPTGVVDLTGAPVALHDGTCANPIVAPEFELGSPEVEPYAEALRNFREDALDEDVPADVQVPGGVPLVDEDLDDDGILDDDEDLDDDGILDGGFDNDGDGVLDEDEQLAGADAALLLIDFPTVWKAEEEVDALLMDEQEPKVRFLQVAAGGFLGIGKRHFLIPVDAITRIDADHVHIDQTRQRVVGAPDYDPTLVPDQTYYDSLYGYYGYAPYWGAGYVYPAYPYYP